MSGSVLLSVAAWGHMAAIVEGLPHEAEVGRIERGHHAVPKPAVLVRRVSDVMEDRPGGPAINRDEDLAAGSTARESRKASKRGVLPSPGLLSCFP